MKTIHLLYYAAIAILASMLYSCNNPTDKTASEVTTVMKQEKKTASVQDTISLHKFNTYVQNWQTSGLSYSSTKLPISFTMKNIDLTEVLGEQPAGVRFYMGLQTVPTSKAHLIVVGVDSNGQDMLDYSNGQYAYDVTCPCPDICPNGGGNVFKCTN